MESENINDWSIVRQYVDKGSDSAFADLVKRYINLVYGASLREVHDHQLAEDVTQAVFLLFARKAKSFNSDVGLASWFFRTAVLTSRSALRNERRLKAREAKAMENAAQHVNSPSL
jgi:RNA polymerase sigma factor (sigma-70 family)